MKKVVISALGLFLAAASSVYAAESKVVDHHVASMKAGDLAAVMTDYAPDAVVVTPEGTFSPSGVFVGANVRKLFVILTSKDNAPGMKSMQSRFDHPGPGVTVMHWVQFKGTPKQVSGHDVFVVRHGKIKYQSVIIDK
jgi:hypothetical protein